MTSKVDPGDGPVRPAGLTIGMAWNGRQDPAAAFAAAQGAPFVAEVLVAPMNDAVAASVRTLAARFTKVRPLPPGDTGLYDAFNKIVAATLTTHIAFHGADDILTAGAVADPSIEAALASATVDDMLVFTAQLCSPSGAPGKTFHHDEGVAPAVTLARHGAPLCPEVAYPVAVLRQAGGFDPGFRVAGDVDLYFRVRPLCRRRDVDRVIVAMRDGGLSASARGARTVWLENRRIARKHGQAVSVHRRLLAHLLLNGRYLLYRLGGEAFANRATDAVRALAGRPPRFTLR